jgi:hypothetical protein
MSRFQIQTPYGKESVSRPSFQISIYFPASRYSGSPLLETSNRSAAHSPDSERIAVFARRLQVRDCGRRSILLQPATVTAASENQFSKESQFDEVSRIQ